jgi:DNA repair protein RecO (recombination protein O)
MHWRDTSIVLASKVFSENSKIITVLNKSLGKTSGLLRSGGSSIHMGNICDVEWKGRTSSQLGIFSIENVFSPFMHVFHNPSGNLALESICTLCFRGLPDKAPHPILYEYLKTLLISIANDSWLVNFVWFEVTFLAEIGFPLNLSKCAVTGSKNSLHYVSPRTGCAVTGDVGEKYKDVLFKLPSFLVSKDSLPTKYDVFCALTITGHFLKKYFHAIINRELPLSRDCLIVNLLTEEKISLVA